MTPTEMASTRSYWVLLAAAGLCVLSSLLMMPYVPDDSYISFRYAENLVNGEGLAFNTAEGPVEGYSNLLWILLCAVLYKVGLNLPGAVPVVGMVVGVLNVFFLWIILSRRGLPGLQMLFPLLLLASSGPFIIYAISGLEMPLYALLLLATVSSIDSIFATGRLRHYVLLTVTGVLLSLCRPEGIVVLPAAIVVIFLLTREPEDTPFHRSRIRNLSIVLVAYAVVVGAYHVWRVSYFGEVLPTPFFSKGTAGQSLFATWIYNLTVYFDQQGGYYSPIGYYFVALTVVGLLGLRLSRSKIHARRTETAAFILAALHGAIYFNFQDWMPAMRYHSSTVGLLLITAVHVQTRFFRKDTVMGRQTRFTFLMSGIAVILISYSVLGNLRVITKRTEVSKQESLVTLGTWLRENMPPGSVLAISDVGAIPYYSGLKTIDIHPESLTDLYIAKNGFNKEYFYRRRPDIVIFPSKSQFTTRFSPEHFAVAEDDRFQGIYRHLGSVRYDWYEDRSYWVFIPRGWPKLSDEAMERFPHGVGSVAHKNN